MTNYDFSRRKHKSLDQPLQMYGIDIMGALLLSEILDEYEIKHKRKRTQNGDIL